MAGLVGFKSVPLIELDGFFENGGGLEYQLMKAELLGLAQRGFQQESARVRPGGSEGGCVWREVPVQRREDRRRFREVQVFF